MRLYSFTNMYTSGIHAGIQTAHVIHEMMRKYEKKYDPSINDGAKLATLYDWADNHKTIIVKCAGYHDELVNLYDRLKPYSAQFRLPMGRWRESKEALNNAQTAVCIVVPSDIYNWREPAGWQPQWPELPYPGEEQQKYELYKIINTYRMAT